MKRQAAFAALVAGPLLMLAGCGGSNPDRLPDDLSTAEGTPIAEGYNADAIEPEPEPAKNQIVEAPPKAIATDELEIVDDGPAPPRADKADFAPSYSCAGRLGQVELWICEDRELAALDRSLARTYARALGDADPATENILRLTGRRFLAYRNACPDPACIAEAYDGRLREIADIMAR